MGPFAATAGTLLYRRYRPTDLVLVVLTLLSYGCSIQGIVAAFGLGERTVATWLARAGQHRSRHCEWSMSTWCSRGR